MLHRWFTAWAKRAWKARDGRLVRAADEYYDRALQLRVFYGWVDKTAERMMKPR